MYRNKRKKSRAVVVRLLDSWGTLVRGGNRPRIKVYPTVMVTVPPLYGSSEFHIRGLKYVSLQQSRSSDHSKYRTPVHPEYRLDGSVYKRKMHQCTYAWPICQSYDAWAYKQSIHQSEGTSVGVKAEILGIR